MQRHVEHGSVLGDKFYRGMEHAKLVMITPFLIKLRECVSCQNAVKRFKLLKMAPALSCKIANLER